ncbi:MAG: hypothetical protein HYX75_11920 [Acidobacteria bacterium]|nr:hypothetical protein [Acidobacteriota bacterium]
MTSIRSVLGYAWAVTAIPIVLATFVGMGTWARGLISITDVKVSPRFTGGEIARTIDHKDYLTKIHRPVFDGLFGERAEGFVQVNWAATAGTLPNEIAEELDLDADGSTDCRIHMDTRSMDVSLTPLNPIVQGIVERLRFDRERAVRISLLNPKLRP